MRKKCYSCCKIREGEVIATGVFVCYKCTLLDEAVALNDKDDQSLRLGKGK